MLRNRVENWEEAKNYIHRYRILFDMMATHWRPRARLRDISPKIKFIRRDANRVFIGHIARGRRLCFSDRSLNNRIWHDDQAQSLYSADMIRHFQEFISDLGIH